MIARDAAGWPPALAARRAGRACLGRRDGPARVDHARLLAAESPASGSRTAALTTSSASVLWPLIDQNTVKDLKLAWSFDLDTKRGQEATPLVVDGTMYVRRPWSKVSAARRTHRQGRSGASMPQVRGATRRIDACCDVVNRGVAAWGAAVSS